MFERRLAALGHKGTWVAIIALQLDITKALPYSNVLLNGNLLEFGYAASHSFD